MPSRRRRYARSLDLTPREVVAFVAAFRAGERFQVLCREFGVTEIRGRTVLQMSGLSRREIREIMRRRVPRTRWQPADPEGLVEAYRSGETSAALAARHGVAPATILRVLRVLGAEIRPGAGPGRKPGPPRPWEPADPEAVLAACRGGAKVLTVARREGVSQAAIVQFLRRAGVPPRARAWMPADPEAVVATYRAGASCRTLAEEHGVRNVTVLRFLRRRGVEIRPRGGYRGGRGGRPAWQPADPEGFVADFLAGATQEQLARRAGVSSSTVRNYLSTRGVGRASKRPWAPGDPEAVVAAYRSGRSCADIAREHGVSDGAVRLFLIRRGEPRRKPGRPTGWSPGRTASGPPAAASPDGSSPRSRRPT